MGELWLHEIKHDGFRIIARKDDNRVRLYSRPGNDLAERFPLIVEAIAALRLDGEAVALDDDGRANFDRLRHRGQDEAVLLYAFDLIELNGDEEARSAGGAQGHLGIVVEGGACRHPVQ
jgi:ATP-dependent DNA ligase